MSKKKADVGLRQLPKFDSEEQERDFWDEADSVEYVDWAKAKRVSLPNLKPSTRTISLRLPQSMIDQLSCSPIDATFRTSR